LNSIATSIVTRRKVCWTVDWNGVVIAIIIIWSIIKCVNNGFPTLTTRKMC
jgi:hypothetical protein